MNIKKSALQLTRVYVQKQCNHTMREQTVTLDKLQNCEFFVTSSRYIIGGKTNETRKL